MHYKYNKANFVKRFSDHTTAGYQKKRKEIGMRDISKQLAHLLAVVNAEEVIQNPISATETSSEIPQESGRTKRKMVPRQLAGAMNGCLSKSIGLRRK